MMFRKILLLAVLAAAAGAATADEYTYIAGGGQAGSMNSSKDNDWVGNIGLYLNGGYGFSNNLFLDMRLNYMDNLGFDITEGMLGIGYHHALSDNADLYALAGISKRKLSFDFLFFNIEEDFNSAIGEAGLKIKLTPDISVNPALGLANYGGDAYYAGRLSAGYALTEHVSAEAGYHFSRWRAVNHHTGTLGLRYTF